MRPLSGYVARNADYRLFNVLIGFALFSSVSCNLFTPGESSVTASPPTSVTAAAPIAPSAPIATDTPADTATLADTATQRLPARLVPAATLTPSLTLVVFVPVKPTTTSTAVPATAAPVISVSDPVGCQRPTDDYTRFRVNGYLLNARTFAMLKHAQELYGGKINMTGAGITQGSYSPGVAASFGTHDGGGAVDIDVVDPRSGLVLQNELLPALHALRVTGFAAWVRLPNELGPGSVIHIHAIAIGDNELSPAARDQLTGQYGYFRGFDGLPQTNGIPIADRYGGPILCQWMLDMGYRDLR
jgi:hypothetical protein